MLDNANTRPVAKRWYRKKNDLYTLLEKMKLWPSRTGRLHGLRSVELDGETVRVATHCGESYAVRNSRNGRAARWLRNKYYTCACGRCAVPDWKLAKYGRTFFSRGAGVLIKDGKGMVKANAG
jgi:pyrrolysyl-tRNA synthetase-like protein